MNAPAATAEASAEAAVPAISVRGLQKSFRGLTVLRGGVALGWCVGLLVVAYVAATAVYRRTTA